jgi:hypothetical protein
LLLLLLVIAYLPLWKNDFVDYDDELHITRNPGVTAGLSLKGINWAWTNDQGPYWIPITWMTLQFDAHFFSSHSPSGEVILSPAAFHGQNLFWHAASVLLLFGLWSRLTGCVWRSFLVAALFAVHPMHVESVAWAIERKDVLSGFFGVVTLWAYTRYTETQSRWWYLCTALAYLLGLLSKPMLITLPFVLLLLDYWPLRRWGQTAAGGEPIKPQMRFGRLVMEKALLFLLATAVAALTQSSREGHGSMVSFSVISLSARLANALSSYGSYLTATVYPCGLAILYPHPHDNWSIRQVLVGTGLLAGLTALSLWQARRRPWLIVGWLWFVGMLFPVIGFSQGGAQGWADRFSYWPHIGLFVAIVWGAGDLAERLGIGPVVTAVLSAILLAGLTTLTWFQVETWRDAETVWEHALAVTENNDRAHEHLAQCYLRQGRRQEAEAQMEAAARIQMKRLRISPR